MCSQSNIMGKNELLHNIIKVINDKFNKSVCYLRFPESTDFMLKGNILYINLKKSVVLNNMQTNGSAFEGWAICIMSYLDCIKRVVLDWEFPIYNEKNKNIKEKHYNRFLLRVLWCIENYKWFSVDISKEEELKHFRNSHKSLVVNYPKSKSKDKGHCDESDKIRKREAVLETKVYNKLNESGNGYANHQLPVGLFDSIVQETSACTPSKASQIDIWQICDKNTFRVYELKIPENSTVGIISELMFYANVMHRLFIVHEINYPDKIKNNFPKFRGFSKICDLKDKIEKIEAIFLSDKLHVLIDCNLDKILSILNCNTNNIVYGSMKVSDILSRNENG